MSVLGPIRVFYRSKNLCEFNNARIFWNGKIEKPEVEILTQRCYNFAGIFTPAEPLLLSQALDILTFFAIRLEFLWIYFYLIFNDLRSWARIRVSASDKKIQKPWIISVRKEN